MTVKDSPRLYAKYSIAASLTTLVLKVGAWMLTGSVGLMSDAAEGMVNLTAGILALSALTIAMRPADDDHSYGHGKAEYFSSGAEGILIILAAIGIGWAAVDRFLSPAPLNHLGWGVAVALIASVVNLVTALSMLRAAKRFDSITLEADARHLLTDVWTSIGLVLGLSIMIFAPQWHMLDPLIAGIMALNIIKTGVELLRRSAAGLMDLALPDDEIEVVVKAITDYAGKDAEFHGLRTRKAGNRRFIDFHLLLPGSLTVKEGHDITEAIEDGIRKTFPRMGITIHVEPLECGTSWDGRLVGGISSEPLPEED